MILPLFLESELERKSGVHCELTESDSDCKAHPIHCGLFKNQLIEGVNQISQKGFFLSLFFIIRYRSLVFGSRTFSEEEWKQVSEELQQAEVSMTNREESVEHR